MPRGAIGLPHRFFLTFSLRFRVVFLFLIFKFKTFKIVLKMKGAIQLFLSLLLCLSPRAFLTMAQNMTIMPVNVGVVLDFSTLVGKMGLSCIQMALSEFYDSNAHYKTRIILHTRDSKEDVVAAAAAALDLIKNVEVQAIIGPESSMQANFIIDIGGKAQVPIISFSATSTSLSSSRSPYFIRATQNDSSQVKAISALVQAFGWRNAVLIYEDNDFGGSIIPFLIDALQDIDIRIPYRSVISGSATNDQIEQELYKLKTMQTRVFIVHMLPGLGSRLFLKAKEVGMMSEGYVWIVTDGLGNLLDSMNSSIIASMQGVLGLKAYIPNTKKVEEFTARWKRKFQLDNPTNVNEELNMFGIRAVDAALALAMAVEEVGPTNLGFQKTYIPGNSTDLDTFGVSQIGPKLRNTLSSSRYKGLAGDFLIVDGQLQPTAFQLFNVIGNGGRGIGFWTPEIGVSRELNFTNRNVSSTFRTNPKGVIWPGESISVPKDWAISKTLRIGVPVKHGFKEFVNVTRNNSTNLTAITGYCIDVFKAVIEAVPYPIPYEFIPFMNPDPKSGKSKYDQLILQVYLKRYDAVVGDVTITETRSTLVDFTPPYDTDSGVSMIAPFKENKRKNAWVFLKPLTWDLWVTSVCFFVYIGFVIWVLEHRINDDFRGPPSNQVGMIFWFSFSTLVFGQKEKVMGNLTRFVVIIWLFVVLILVQSYTASYTSLLTVEQLLPTVNDVNELIRRGDYVGFKGATFVLDLLKQIGFDASKLKVYSSVDELDEALSLGSGNGGIAAAFDENPYIRVFLAKYSCSKYTMLGPTFKTDGFGFVFAKGSPLVQDVSKAVLNLTVSGKLKEIRKVWFGQETNCSLPGTNVSSYNIGLDRFWGLFLIAAITSSLALIIFAVMFLYEHWHFLEGVGPDASLWRKIMVMVTHFNIKDHNFNIFRNTEVQDKTLVNGINAVGASTRSLNHSVISVEQETGDSSPNSQAPQEIVPVVDPSYPYENLDVQV